MFVKKKEFATLKRRVDEIEISRPVENMEEKCRKCKEHNKLFEILKILQWKGYDNYLTALSYDQETEQILVDKDALMRAIQFANPGQHYRDIRLITHEEHMEHDLYKSDYTSWDERARREKQKDGSAKMGAAGNSRF